MRVDIAIVGGGIAGMSVAAELSRDPSLRIAVLEQETQLAYHASGRSAAAFLETYGGPDIRALTRASRPLFDPDDLDGADPDGAGYSDGSGEALLTSRPLLWVASRDHVDELAELVRAEPLLRPIDAARARALCPALRADWVVAGAVEDGARDLDVAGLFDRYRRRAVRADVAVRTGARVRRARRDGHTWRVETDGETIDAGVLVNAAGAWADEVARACGLAARGLGPLRRTVAVVSCGAADRSWPLVADVAEGFYFRPEGAGLLVSPADETPSQPCDARAAYEDVALALDRANEATTLGLRHVTASWAGLRTFAPDRNPVVGYDPDEAGFFWLAGQGGYGMQTAPAMAVLAAALIRGDGAPAALLAEGLDPSRLEPGRLLAG
jgi:D-arginine dehydrogenase